MNGLNPVSADRVAWVVAFLVGRGLTGADLYINSG